MEYRIKEYLEGFEIQVKGYENKGILWWKKKEWSWNRTNIWGGVWRVWPIPEPFCKTFKTLKSAKEKLKEFKRKKSNTSKIFTL